MKAYRHLPHEGHLTEIYLLNTFISADSVRELIFYFELIRADIKNRFIAFMINILPVVAAWTPSVPLTQLGTLTLASNLIHLKTETDDVIYMQDL